jgi:hypothetical protein
MAATVAEVSRDNTGGRLRLIVDITGDNSYPTGGWAVTPAQLGVQRIDRVSADVKSPSTTSYIAQWDYANNKIKVFWTGAAVNGTLGEVTNATNLSTLVLRAEVVGN